MLEIVLAKQQPYKLLISEIPEAAALFRPHHSWGFNGLSEVTATGEEGQSFPNLTVGAGLGQ